MAYENGCGTDTIRNTLVRGQHDLETQFGQLKGPLGYWAGRVRNLGAFPNGSGWARRVTTLGFQRPRHTNIRFRPMVGLQDDCASSCDVPANLVKLGHADHLWVRMTEYAENTEPFCLIQMLGEAQAGTLGQQVRNHFRILKDRTAEITDEFKRANYAALSRNKWMGVMGRNAPKRGLWRFAQDENGQPDINYIILNDADIDPADISLPTLSQLNYIIETGGYRGAFDGTPELLTDYDTAQELPKFDTNVRADNRERSPNSLNPALGAVTNYGGINLPRDPFALRYSWVTDDDAYPDGVFKRIEHWSSKQISEGCWDDISEDYMEGDFQLSVFYNDDVMGLRNVNIETPDNMPFAQPQSPYNGMWRFINENDPVTPCNTDRTKAYWRMVMRWAAEPINSGEMGHVVFHRRFNTRGPVRSCRPLQVVVGGSYSCFPECSPIDAYPPALVVRDVCAAYDASALTSCS